MTDHPTDKSILKTITHLVNEEHVLYSGTDLDGDAQARLEELRIELDQCWDLLRQRRALREFGEDPDKAKVRPPEIVERYKQ
jgi:hypothetical protein